MDPGPETSRPRRGGRLLIVGAAVALLAGLGVAWALMTGGQNGARQPPPASQGGLVIEEGDDQSRIDPAKPLRCFVQGQFVGELSLADCARRNGVATDALDVGLDPTGALAADQVAGETLTPLPPEEDVAAEPPAEVVESSPPPAPAEGACWRYARPQWRRLPQELDLNGCVQALFAGRCERPGSASYGRWGQQTLRLVTGKVEISSDNQTFHTLASQTPNCAIPPIGGPP